MIGLLKKPLSICLFRNSKCTSGNSSSQVGSVRFRLFGISLNTAKMKYVISKVLNVCDLSKLFLST